MSQPGGCGQQGPCTALQARRQYLLTCEVSRYCFLALQGSIEAPLGKVQRETTVKVAKLKNVDDYISTVASIANLQYDYWSRSKLQPLTIIGFI